MDIAGIQKLTLVDFPGRVAATIFTRGCNFRCGFCHNPELVIPEEYIPLLDEQQLFDFLRNRYGKLTGICITGGEPLMQKDISKFIVHMKALGFDVKLDTNGALVDRLEEIIKEGEIDYIAMDVKSSLAKYAMTTQVESRKLKVESPKKLQENIQKSIRLIMESGIDYEFRTTVCHPLHEVADFEEIGQMIQGAKRYYIQNFVQSKHINEHVDYAPFTDKELKEAKRIMSKFVKDVEVR